MSFSPTRISLLALACLIPSGGPAFAYEDFSRREGMRCAECHVDLTGFGLTDRGKEYKLNGYSFPSSTPAPTAPATPDPTDVAVSVDPRTMTPMKSVMRRTREALWITVEAVADGRYGAAVEGAKKLHDLGGRIEGHLRSAGRGNADTARALRDAAYRLERTLRTGGDRRLALAPIQVGQIVGTCLTCHAIEGLTDESFRLAGPREEPSGPDAIGVRPETPLPRRERGATGSRR